MIVWTPTVFECLICMRFLFLYLHLFSAIEHVSHGKALLKYAHYYYYYYYYNCWHFLEYFFHTVISSKLKICKEIPRELNSVSGDWPVFVKAASNLLKSYLKKSY